MTSLVISSASILLSFLVGLAMFRKLEAPWLRLFVFSLLVSFTVQIAGYLYSYYTRKSNHFIFNFEINFEFIFFLYVFNRVLSGQKFQVICAGLSIMFLLFAFYNLLWGESLWIFNAHTVTVGSLVILICCMLYFWQLFTADYIVNFFSIPMFWIATGLFFYYIGNFIYMSIFSYIQKNNLDPTGMAYVIINVGLSVLQYAFFTVGFLCTATWKKAKS